MKKKISVIGVGRLGLSFALLLDSKGYDVVGCDVNEKYIQSLNDKTFSSKEPGVNELLSGSNIAFTTSTTDAFNHSDFIFVFVPTPSNAGGDYNHKYVQQVVSKLKSNKVENKTLVIGCTVMPYYCETVKNDLLDLHINVVYNPEFISQGQILNGLKNADIVLIGGSLVPQLLFDIYREIMTKEPDFKVLSLTGAGIAKIAINCFLSMKIAYANLIGEIVINSYEQENIDQILETIGSDSRIGRKYLSYGFPGGGPCIPRDQKALNNHAFRVGISSKFMQEIDCENNRHSEYLKEFYIKVNPDKEVPFIFNSLSYKSGTDILTHSYQLKLCMDLLNYGYKVDVPTSIKDAEMPEEFYDYCYNDKVTFSKNPKGCKIN